MIATRPDQYGNSIWSLTDQIPAQSLKAAGRVSYCLLSNSLWIGECEAQLQSIPITVTVHVMCNIGKFFLAGDFSFILPRSMSELLANMYIIFAAL